MALKKCMSIFGSVFVLFLSFESMVFAQKVFEGTWKQTTITESQTPRGKRTETQKQTVYYKSGKMLIRDSKTGDLVIFRPDKELIWTVNKKEGTYTEMTFAQMEEATEHANKAMSEMMEEMKNLPPEQQEMMQKMMGKQMGVVGGGKKTKIRVKRTGETKDISGYECKHIVISSDNIPLLDMWVTDKFNLGEDFFKFYQKMGRFKFDFTKEMKKIEGFVMQSRFTMDTPGAKVKITTTVTKIKPSRSVCDDCAFKRPSGFKKKEISIMPSK